MQLILLVVLAALMVSSAATARAAFEFSQSQGIKLESLTLYGTKHTLIYGSYDTGLRYILTDQFKIGADLGLDYTQLDEANGGASYLTGVIDSRYGKISIGKPRLVMPAVFDAPELGGSRMLDLLQGRSSEEWQIIGAFFSEVPPLHGMRYDGKFGQIEIAAAMQNLGTAEKWVRAATLSYQFGAHSISVGRTTIDLNKSRAAMNKLALRVAHGRIAGGLMASRKELFGFHEKIINAFLSYDISDHVAVNAQVFHVTLNHQSYVDWGADVVYRHNSGLFLQTGIAQLKRQSDRAINLSLGYKF